MVGGRGGALAEAQCDLLADSWGAWNLWSAATRHWQVNFTALEELPATLTAGRSAHLLTKRQLPCRAGNLLEGPLPSSWGSKRSLLRL